MIPSEVSLDDFGPDLLDPSLAAAMRARGFTHLTSVQRAVLDPNLRGRDLRITSRTGSGKTVALGFVLCEAVTRPASTPGHQPPRCLVIAPTRELAQQVGREFGWLYASMGVRIATVTGGADYRGERRSLAASPAVVVGTPGRLLDHIERGALDVGGVQAVALDEADRMLDMGFREELEKILGATPPQRATHMMSATFPHDVQALADKVQRDAVHVQGTRLGEANADIDHVVHLVDQHQKVDAVINLLLAHPADDTLLFARTRVEVAELAAELLQAGFAVASLSGELDQSARDRSLSAFRRGDVRVLVATDVAARGIDVVDIARVIHVDPPGDADTYTHRSGRTGRAGRQGTSSVLVTPAGLRRATALLDRAHVTYRFEPIPTPASIAAEWSDRVFAELTAPDPEGFHGFDDHVWSLARRLAEADDVTRVIARLVSRSQLAGPTYAREVRVFDPPAERSRPNRGTGRTTRAVARGEWVTFRVAFGRNHGADARKLLAMVCRRGGIRGQDVGAIRIGPTQSEVDVRAQVAEGFADAAARVEPRNARVTIRRVEAPARPTRPTRRSRTTAKGEACPPSRKAARRNG